MTRTTPAKTIPAPEAAVEISPHLLANAEAIVRERGLDKFTIVDTDAHHLELDDWDRIIPVFGGESNDPNRAVGEFTHQRRSLPPNGKAQRTGLPRLRREGRKPPRRAGSAAARG